MDISIYNNLAGNAIRPITLDRKIYLFCGNNEATENMSVVCNYSPKEKKVISQTYKGCNHEVTTLFFIYTRGVGRRFTLYRTIGILNIFS
jgi:hypothetical protein